MGASNANNVPFFAVLGPKRLPIDDLDGQHLLPILNLETTATKEVSHFSGLSLTFLFVKKSKLIKKQRIRF